MTIKNLTQIARELGISLSTVSRAVSNQGRVAPETRRKVLELLRDSGIGKNRAYKPVMLLLPSGNALDWYSVQMINQLREIASEKGFTLEMLSLEMLPQMRERYYCGIISLDYYKKAAPMLGKKLALPLICINDAGDRVNNVYSIRNNSAQSLRDAVLYLLGCNHRKIGFFRAAKENSYEGKLRERAFVDAMREFGFGDGILIQDVYWDKRGALVSLLQRGATALIAQQESTSLELLHTCRTLNIRVPEDLSLITGEVGLFSQYQDPPLSTIEQNYREIAMRAFDTLERLMDGKPAPMEQTVDCIINKRESVAVLPLP